MPGRSPRSPAHLADRRLTGTHHAPIGTVNHGDSSKLAASACSLEDPPMADLPNAAWQRARLVSGLA